MEPAFSSWPTGTPDHHSPIESLKEKPKKPRHRHSAIQLAALNELYDRNEHPSLDDRTSLAEKLGMETKTVNAWFQNKRAATKKRSRPGQSSSTYDLPPISTLLSPVDSSAPSLIEDTSISDFTPALPPMQEPATSINYKHPSPEATQQQSAFYAGNPEHDHAYESAVPVLPPRPRIRMRPSLYQSEELRKAYIIDPHPSKEQREEIGRRIGMRYQSVTNWFQNQRSLAKKRFDDDVPFDKPQLHNSSTIDINADTQLYSRDTPALKTPAFPPRSSHPSVSTLVRRENRSPSVERSNASSSSRGSPYHSIIPPHRPRRTRPEPHQLAALQKLYNRTSNPSIEERGALALEVGMDVAKVTNWFRNLRQTTRKRAQKPSDEGDAESIQLGSGFASRAVTPSVASSYSVSLHEADHVPDPDHDIDTDTEDLGPMKTTTRKHIRVAPSDAGTDDEEYQEAVTPSPEPSPLPHPPTTVLPTSRPHQIDVRGGINISPIDYDRLEKIPGRLSGVRVEDALLLLGFHHHIVH
ncbi:homeobox-domain-containing protein [Russula earlei]|uniref:Homeobox-domain-containing protein n=1 Tax=Russula earlei TaxID=71964 RepID=A0ACC0U139_9AGAM|nr:homeobox-domain-containing protein [Russula earlei]